MLRNIRVDLWRTTGTYFSWYLQEFKLPKSRRTAQPWAILTIYTSRLKDGFKKGVSTEATAHDDFISSVFCSFLFPDVNLHFLTWWNKLRVSVICGRHNRGVLWYCRFFVFSFGVKFWNTLFTVAVQEPCLQANAVPTKGDRLAEPNPWIHPTEGNSRRTRRTQSSILVYL